MRDPPFCPFDSWFYQYHLKLVIYCCRSKGKTFQYKTNGACLWVLKKKKKLKKKNLTPPSFHFFFFPFPFSFLSFFFFFSLFLVRYLIT